MQLLRDSNAAT